MIITKDGAKVKQLVPVPVYWKENNTKIGTFKEAEFYSALSYYTDYGSGKGYGQGHPVMFLAVMDDGSVRPIGIVRKTFFMESMKDERGNNLVGSLAFLEDVFPDGWGVYGDTVYNSVGE